MQKKSVFSQKKRNIMDEGKITKNVYEKPGIIAELELETRAGSPLGAPEFLEDE